jgi:CHAD domain-containing protein
MDVVLFHAGRLGDGPEAVHQMRVAVRRARSALSVFRPAFAPGALDGPRAAFKALNGRFGPTRDWDVFAEETAPAIQQVLPADERLERLLGAANRRRRDCQKALAAYLASAEFRQAGIELAWFAAATSWHAVPAEAPEPGAEPLAEAVPAPLTLSAFAGQVLQHRWKRLVSAGKRMEGMDVPSLHGVRLRAKQARYAAEIFSTLHHGKAAARFIRRLSELQQRLGVLNDGAVAMQLMVELGGPGGRHAYAAGLVSGFMAARAEKIRPRIIAAFDKFRRQPAYWA